MNKVNLINKNISTNQIVILIFFFFFFSINEKNHGGGFSCTKSNILVTKVKHSIGSFHQAQRSYFWSAVLLVHRSLFKCKQHLKNKMVNTCSSVHSYQEYAIFYLGKYYYYLHNTLSHALEKSIYIITWTCMLWCSLMCCLSTICLQVPYSEW